MSGGPYVELDPGFHWAAIPDALIGDPEVSDAAMRVYAVLVRHGTDPENCYPSHARIAERMGGRERSKRSVPAWINELEAAGWVDRIARIGADGAPTSNGYRVHAVPARRAGQRGVPAEQRAPLPAEQRAPSPPHSAPKESQGTKASSNEPAATPRGDDSEAPEAFAEDEPTITAEHKSEAATLTRAVYKRRADAGEPKPATPVPGAIMIAARFLALGYDRQDVGRAMYRASAITRNAVEVELRRARAGPGRPGQSADDRRGGMVTDRDIGGVWTPTQQPGEQP